ncbi:MAG: DUF1810 domain-containing protein [Phycisphaerae bacterium]
MTGFPSRAASEDPHALHRFVEAQQDSYGSALSEIRRGRKQSHWMWYIFPQYEGLGFSATAKHYAIKSRAEARAYLDHAVLGLRLAQCVEALLAVEGRTAHEILGSPDDLKLKSCATLFAEVAARPSVFERLLAKYFGNQRDEKTLALLRAGA